MKSSVGGDGLITGGGNVMNMRGKSRQEGSWVISRTSLSLCRLQVLPEAAQSFSSCSHSWKKPTSIWLETLYLPLYVCKRHVCGGLVDALLILQLLGTNGK